MALPTGGVALLAVIFKGCRQSGTFLQTPPSGFKGGFHPAERGVETDSVRMGNIFVAGDAGAVVILRRVSYQSHMSEFLVVNIAIATVTNNAANFAVGAFHKVGIFQEDLLPYLQRR